MKTYVYHLTERERGDEFLRHMFGPHDKGYAFDTFHRCIGGYHREVQILEWLSDESVLVAVLSPLDWFRYEWERWAKTPPIWRIVGGIENRTLAALRAALKRGQKMTPEQHAKVLSEIMKPPIVRLYPWLFRMNRWDKLLMGLGL